MSITALLIAVLGGGVFIFVKEMIQWVYTTRKASRPDRVEAARIHESVAQADASLITVARARDLLASDNASLRQEREQMRAAHAADRAEWQRERGDLRREIDELEARLRTALSEVQDMRVRHGMVNP